tara:strand:+ start:192 stop:416 length:225 start_codon:yes stop_codon:yes gene_type:complete
MSKKTKNIYVHETYELHQSNGEIYISGKNFQIVWNSETLFTDLPFIIKLVYDARQETNNSIKERIDKIQKTINE